MTIKATCGFCHGKENLARIPAKELTAIRQAYYAKAIDAGFYAAAKFAHPDCVTNFLHSVEPEHYLDRVRPITEHVPFFGKQGWAGLSQYGYVLAWFYTEAEAADYVVRYYLRHPELCD